MWPPIYLQGPSPLPQRGSCSHSSLTPTHESRFSPLTCISFAPHLGICTVSIPFHWFTVGTEPSKPVVKYLSISITCILSGNAWVSNFMTSSSVYIRKSIGHSSSSRSSPVFALVLPTSIFPAFVILLGYSYTTHPSWHLTASFPSWYPTAPSTPGWRPTSSPSEWATLHHYTQIHLPCGDLFWNSSPSITSILPPPTYLHPFIS